jgi:hypothetical protein
LADLPHELRGRAIAALEDLSEAVTLGDPDAAAKPTQVLRDIIAEIGDIKAARGTTKLFASVPRVSGQHEVAKFFAERAGVKPA